MQRLFGRSAVRVVSRAPSRAFAAEAVISQEIPKPVDTAGRYATALYSAATKTSTLDSVIADAERMREMQATNSTLSEFLKNPSLPSSAKVETMTEIIKKAGFSQTFSQFLMVMAENGRMNETEKSLNSFQDIIATLKGEVIVKVTTTIPMSEWEMALLKKKIKHRFFSEKPDAELTVETAIDQDLMGGLTIQVGDRFMDLSTRTELRKLQEMISKSVA